MMKPLQKPLAVIRSVDLASAPKWGLTVLSMSLIAACSTPAPPSAPPVEAKAAEAPAPQPVAEQSTVAVVVATTESPRDAFERALSGVAKESVFFDFDRFAIKSDQVTAITDNAQLASSYPSDYLTLQGNCDERGSREYNLALGQRRADAVKTRLVLLGIAEERIETISFGKEKPRELCHSETCWSENRRADFVHELK